MGLGNGSHHDQYGVPPFQTPPPNVIRGNPIPRPQLTSPETSFPILLVSIIGILTTAFLLASYYVFVVKCCLNSQRVDFFRPRRREQDQLIVYASSSQTESSGLDESVIQAIPIVRFKRTGKEGDYQGSSFCECAVCLNEFQEEEKLRVLPSCSHAFHIDCIDTWLQSNANCPLCRSSISRTIPFPSNNAIGLSHPPQDHDPSTNTVMGGDENFVVIEVRSGDEADQANHRHPKTVHSEIQIPSPRKLEQRFLNKKARKFHCVSSMGDECLDVRRKDDQFAVQPIRRSISMDSSADRQLYLSVQEILQQNKHFNEFSTIELGCTSSSGSSSNRIRSKSFFSIGSGRGSRNAVLPVEFNSSN